MTSSPYNFTMLAVVTKNQRRVVLAMAAVLLATTATIGCSSPAFTRYPVPWAGHPRSESMAYQYQDPFPDPDIGPETYARPRDFTRPRTEARQAAEQRLFQGLPVGPEYVPPGVPQGGLNRPAAVY